MPPKTTVVHNVSAGPSVEKAELKTKLEPDAAGKYVFDKCDPRATAAISFSAVANTIEVFEKALGQPITWAFNDPKLGIIPDAGEDFNAYYSRDDQSLNFFHGTDPVTGAKVMSGASGEVVSHEAGHAILDGLRPGYFSTWSVDPGAFHESFGDLIGMLMAFQDDRAVARAVVQSGGDLSKPSLLSNTGEQLGVAINDYVGANSQGTGGDYVRTAINTFKWAEPSTLPQPTGPDQLGGEVHDFSRLWTGAFYDVLKGIQERNMQAGMAPAAALKATGTEGLTLLADLMKTAPQGDFTYRDMAQAFVESDVKFNGGKDADLIRKVYTDRLILPADAPPAEPTPAPAPTPTPSPAPAGSLFTSTETGRVPLADTTRTVSVRLSGPEFGRFDGARVETLVDRDGGLTKDATVSTRTQDRLEKLIADGRILYRDPSEHGKPAVFDAQGRPYIGYLRWENGEMIVERSKVAT